MDTSDHPAESFAVGDGASTCNGLVQRVDGPVGWIVFDRPSARNAMDARMLAALPGAWRRFEDDPEVRVIVVTGAGTAFQTGLDVVALARDPRSLRDSTRRTREGKLQLTSWHLGGRKPVIAAVNGVCAGGGLHFVVDADLVLAVPEAYFTDPHVSVGQASAWEAVGLTRRMPASIAASLALGGRHKRLNAARAHQVGLVGEVVSATRLHARAQELGEIIAAADPALVQARRHALWANQETGLSAATDYAIEGARR